jgi:hypothetical protein
MEGFQKDFESLKNMLEMAGESNSSKSQKILESSFLLEELFVNSSIYKKCILSPKGILYEDACLRLEYSRTFLDLEKKTVEISITFKNISGSAVEITNFAKAMCPVGMYKNINLHDRIEDF